LRLRVGPVLETGADATESSSCDAQGVTNNRLSLGPFQVRSFLGARGDESQAFRIKLY
jgi:hypothetical protein